MVVLYRFSTSNHNRRSRWPASGWLYYIVSLHQTTTRVVGGRLTSELYYIVSLHQTTTTIALYCANFSCIISFLYIKPQHVSDADLAAIVVLYRFSTSNHNLMWSTFLFLMLYYIVSLHQTTTLKLSVSEVHRLYYIVSLHQTTTQALAKRWRACCIISFLYIKPQHDGAGNECEHVVLYRFSTSNHN